MRTLEDNHAREYGKLPEVLYLQFDKCWRENKNKFELAFFYLLVALGLGKKVSTCKARCARLLFTFIVGEG